MHTRTKQLIIAVSITAVVSTGAAFALFVAIGPSLVSRRPPAQNASNPEPLPPRTFTDPPATPRPQAAPVVLTTRAQPTVPMTTPQGKPVSLVKLVKMLKPTVVHIGTSKRYAAGPLSSWMGGHRWRRATGLGTGVIIDKDGHIVTNNHVIGQADLIQVRLVDGREFQATIKGRDPDTDLAVIKINPDTPLPFARFGKSADLQIGEWVVAIGNPFGLDHSVTAGIVSAKGRRNINPGGKRGYWNFIQTDASINPGNSGGPLINLRGEVIGINTAIDGRGPGIGFAIPADMAKVIVPQLLKGQRFERSYIGVSIQSVTQQMVQSFKLPRKAGAMVSGVKVGSPAFKAGVQAGDVIVRFDGKEVVRSSDLPWLASTAGVGKRVELELIRRGKGLRVHVTLTVHPSSRPRARPGVGGRAELGLVVSEVTPDLARLFGLQKLAGVVIMMVEAGTEAEQKGVVRGEVILQVGTTVVQGMADYINAVRRTRRGENVMLRIASPAGSSRWVTVRKN